MLKKVVKAVLFNVSKLIVIAFFLLVSEQVFAHANHSFFEQSDSLFEQSFFDDPAVTKGQAIAKPNISLVVIKQILITNIQQPSDYISVLWQKHIVFQNHILLEKPSTSKKENNQQYKGQVADDCNCLDDCSCLDCQCANCPMASGCHATSVMLLHGIIAVAQPIHEILIFNILNYFISQPHTIPFRPPILA